jgi:hypothetical protein
MRSIGRNTTFDYISYLAASTFKAGNCSLEEAGAPLAEIVENYLQKFPGKSITLIGTSRGAQITSYIETKLDPALLQNRTLTVFSIAGVHGGTQLMDLAHRICCAKALRNHPAIKQGLSFGSQESNQLVSSLQERQKVWAKQGTVVSHYFFATTEDEKVRPISSSLPYLESTPSKNYQILSGESHETIVVSLQNQIFTIMKTKRE